MRIVRRDYASPLGIVLTIINIVLGIILFLIALRIIFLLLGANPLSGFVNFVYDTTQPFVAPFRGIFPSDYLGSGSFLDAAAILAFVIYSAILGLINFTLNRYGGGGTVEEDL